MTNPLDAVRGDPVDSYDWTGDGVDEDGGTGLPVWDDALDGPVYPARPFCGHNDHCYEERAPEQSVLREAPAHDNEGGSVSTLETVETHTCVSVRCRTCGDEVWENNDDMNGTPHWPSVEEAKARLTSESWGPWLWDDNGPQCPDCVNKAKCAAEGCAWEEWRDGLRVSPPREYDLRWCGRCGKFERRSHEAPVASGG